MRKLSKKRLHHLLWWCTQQKDTKGRTLLERAKESIVNGTYLLRYITNVDIATEEDPEGIVYFDCTCPFLSKRPHEQRPCKHVIAHLLLIHEKELRESSKKWEEWFSQVIKEAEK